MFTDILIPVGVLAGLSIFLGVVLAAASKIFAVKVDQKVALVNEKLPGANCGACGYSGCAALAEAIVKGEAKPNACPVGGDPVAEAVGEVLGVKVDKVARKRAQVMCSGTGSLSTKKYHYEGALDCVAAAKIGGGDRLCKYGCIGFGTCAAACPFSAIEIIEGVAAVDYEKCRGCGLCVVACPKQIIGLIPYDSAHWVGCCSTEKPAVTRAQCQVGCIGCRICEKNCPTGAITVSDFLAVIDYDKCIDCGICVQKCPRHIIWSSKRQDGGLIITRDTARVGEKKA